MTFYAAGDLRNCGRWHVCYMNEPIITILSWPKLFAVEIHNVMQGMADNALKSNLIIDSQLLLSLQYREI